jgi:hypothetical protein
VKDVTKYKYYEGGVTASGVGAETGFAFTRRRRGCFCVPEEGERCCHRGWTGDVDRDAVMPAGGGGGGGGGAQRVTRQAARRSGPSAAFRASIDNVRS